MASHVYHEIYLHITWHTKDDSLILIPGIELLVHQILTERCHQTKGVYFHGINGTPTHVHLAINIEPQVTISDLVGELKGFSSHEVNKQQRMKRLEWQRGFGVVSFGQRNLPWVQNYIPARRNIMRRESWRLGWSGFRLMMTERSLMPEDRTRSRLKPAHEDFAILTHQLKLVADRGAG